MPQSRHPEPTIVRLIRPEGGGSKWLLYAPGGVSGYIDAPVELERAMETQAGWFYATHTDEGWDIGERAPDQPW